MSQANLLIHHAKIAHCVTDLLGYSTESSKQRNTTCITVSAQIYLCTWIQAPGTQNQRL